MPPIRVIIAATGPDLQADGILAAVRGQPGDSMQLVSDSVVEPAAVEDLLDGLPLSAPCAVFLVHAPSEDNPEFDQLAARWMDASDALLLLEVSAGDGKVMIAARNLGMDALLAAVGVLIGGDSMDAGSTIPDQAAASAAPPSPRLPLELGRAHQVETPLLPRPSGVLLGAATEWVHAVLRAAVGRLVDADADGSASLRLPAVADWIARRPVHDMVLGGDEAVRDSDVALEEALAAADESEPLARVVRVLRLDRTEQRLLFLALSPELDARHQRWISLLLDETGRRHGSIALYAELIGDGLTTAAEIAAGGRLARWRLVETFGGMMPAADEPLRVDAPMRRWLLGGALALGDDPALAGLLREQEWPGMKLIAGEDARERARELADELIDGDTWLLLDGDALATWRALIECGAEARACAPIRVELAGIDALAAAHSAEAAVRLARMALLTGQPLAVDASKWHSGRPQESELCERAASAFLAALTGAIRRGAIITPEPARVAARIGAAPFKIAHEALSGGSRTCAFEAAAVGAGACFTHEAAETLANLFPLELDGLEQAMRIALARPHEGNSEEGRRTRFMTAAKEVAAAGASGLAQRIEPGFTLADLVLPEDRIEQLREIVGNISFAPKVLGDWKFREQLPYGLGVTALFHGASGTGKTVAAMAVANELGVQVLRIDLSRLVSKYIGETEKNIDRIFLEAQRSGAALLLDEADGLLARRSEVKDAHDRYANIEVAYLLQRMEAHEGLAILTTNLRQNLDPAFTRRLRFVVEFPRPDAVAREAIWRMCLPSGAHEISDASFRQLARRFELTGGSIRQITLRAAFIAAAGGSRIQLVHIVQAIRAEYAKLGVPPVEFDLGEERRAA